MSIPPPPIEPVRRSLPPATMLWLALAIVAVGSVLALAGARMTWTTFEREGRTVAVEGGGVVELPATVNALDGDADMGGTTATGAGLIALAVLAAMAGPRLRTAALVAIVLLGALAAFRAVGEVAIYDLPTDVTVRDGPGRAVFGAGGFIAAFGALGALPVARRVPRLRMPERSADEDALTDPPA